MGRNGGVLVALLLLAGGACDGRPLGPPLGGLDPGRSSGLHVTFDGLGMSPDPAVLAGIREGGVVGLPVARWTASEVQTLKFVVRCALAAGSTISKADAQGSAVAFEGALGLAPQIETGACDVDCQEILSACLMAHISSSSAAVPLWLTAGSPAIGRETSLSYPIEEATFFGNLWAQGGTAAYCKAPTASDGVVPGRIGVHPGDGDPRDDLLADKYYRNADERRAGTCAACSRSTSGAVEACALDGVTFAHPVTVWRSRAYQAEAASLSGGARVGGNVGRVLDVRASYMRPGAGVTFEGIFAAHAGSNTLAIYYTNGDPVGSAERKLAIAVNGSPARVEAFPPNGAGWDDARLRLVELEAFREGANTITFTVPADVTGPDLDWIQVVPAAP